MVRSKLVPGAGSALATAELVAYRGIAASIRAGATLATMGRSRGAAVVWRERLGRWPCTSGDVRGAVWVHAASVGEVGVARTLFSALHDRLPEAVFLLTCNTATGRQLGTEIAAVKAVRYFPIDHPGIVRSVLTRVRPRMFLFIETEIWPNFLLEIERRGIPAAMINARISDRYYPYYRLARALIRPVLATVDVVSARDDVSARRLMTLGADPARTCVAGDLKLDAIDEDTVRRTVPLPVARTRGCPILVAASTHDGEDEIVLDAFDRVRRLVGGSRLVLAPRHPQRSERVARLAAEGGRRVAVWSRAAALDRDWDVLVVDTVGQLRGFFKGAAAVFVGGSLVPVGGHNLMEPAAYALPIATGPLCSSVAAQTEALARAGALEVVDGAEALACVWSTWLQDATAAAAIGRRASRVVEQGRGALTRTMEALAAHGLI